MGTPKILEYFAIGVHNAKFKMVAIGSIMVKLRDKKKFNRPPPKFTEHVMETFKNIYACTIFGIKGESLIILPVPPSMKHGRGNKSRRKDADEVLKLKNKTKLKRKQTTVKCSSCGAQCHNDVTCGRYKETSEFGVEVPIEVIHEFGMGLV
ncbi:hypothetical protein OROGR_008322 [Orobanche gracilis]